MMTRKIMVAVAIAALTSGLAVSSASAKKHVNHATTTGAASTPGNHEGPTAIPGNNPMTMAPAKAPEKSGDVDKNIHHHNN